MCSVDPIQEYRGDTRRAYGVLMGKPEGKRPLGWPKCRWEVNIKMDLQVVRWGGMGWICPTQEREGGGHL